MPKINSKVFSKDQQQKLRRMAQREAQFEAQFAENNIKCCTLDRLYATSTTELTDLLGIIKKMIQHNKKTDDLIAEGCYKSDAIIDDYDDEMSNYLAEKYKGQKGKILKYTYCHQKDKFREEVINDNQLQFNNRLSTKMETSIKKLYDDIDISGYELTDCNESQ